ncbi:GIY-YIG nuclease family protein [Cupriavidus necator]|uniref:GIY-YIG nuclease family protein n=1 Tax=Cupriavidus necator TaxID=106590 RepID=UPI002ED9F7D6
MLSKPCPVPREPGLYAWYFKQVPAGVPTSDCIRVGDLTLLYIGISPRAAPLNGKPASRQRLRHRVQYHYRGNAEGSTLRLTLTHVCRWGAGALALDVGERIRCVACNRRSVDSRAQTNR